MASFTPLSNYPSILSKMWRMACSKACPSSFRCKYTAESCAVKVTHLCCGMHLWRTHLVSQMLCSEHASLHCTAYTIMLSLCLGIFPLDVQVFCLRMWLGNAVIMLFYAAVSIMQQHQSSGFAAWHKIWRILISAVWLRIGSEIYPFRLWSSIFITRTP